MLPAKRQPKPSGIERAPKRDWPRHRRFVKSHACCVPNCEAGPIECAHIRLDGGGGTGLKPHDAHCISLCAAHHAESHRTGETTFARRYGLKLQALAHEFATKSPVPEVRDYARQSP